MKTILARLLPPVLAVFCLTVPGLCADKVLNLYIWSEYIPDEVIKAFTKETGIKVNLSTYDSNEAMYAKVKLVGKGYDLVVPSSDYVGLMRREGLLMPVDLAKLPNFKLILPQFTNLPHDPGNGYSVPYMWGSTSIAFNSKQLAPEKMRRMVDLWQPELNGKLLLPNDVREVMGLGLKVLGYSINEKDPEHLRQAYEKLTALMPMVRVFDSDSPKQALLSGEVTAGVMWNGEAFVAAGENKAIHYVYPPEGFSLWLDSFCIPKGAEHIEAAHRFMDYVLRPKVAATISENMGYSTPNSKAFDFLPASMKKNAIFNPPPQDAARGEFLDSLDDATLKLYEQYWVKLKTR